MEAITISALLLLLVLVTPSLVLIFVFRVFYPKTRTISSSDTTTLLICCILNLFINGYLLEEYVGKVLGSKEISFLDEKQLNFAKSILVTPDRDSTLIRPTETLGYYFKRFQFSSTSIWALIFDLHLRTLLFGFLIFIPIHIIGKAEEILQAIPYSNRKSISWYKHWFALLFGYNFKKSKPIGYEKKKVALNIFGFEITKLFRDVVYHQWAILTMTNPRREILMADVLTTEGSLYTGVLVTWVQTDHTAAEIVLEYTLRYYPSHNTKEDKTLNNKIVSRKTSFIKNNGQMIISRNQIETIHFWEIRKGFEAGITIKCENDLERLKQILVLAFIYPGFFSKIFILVETQENDWLSIQDKLLKWIEDNEIVFKKEEISIDMIFKEDQATSK